MSYGTHLYPLTAALLRAPPGPILELGCGYWSTPALHGLCRVQGRQLLTADVDAGWLERFRVLECESHKLVHVTASWDDLDLESQLWSLALVDHSPGERRPRDIERLRDHAGLVLAHDSETPTYGYDAVFPLYKFRKDYDVVRPWTTILSNSIDVRGWDL